MWLDETQCRGKGWDHNNRCDLMKPNVEVRVGITITDVTWWNPM